MPELPEVETIRRDLEQGILNTTVKQINIFDKRVLRQPVPDFEKRLKGRRITSINRRGKALVLTLDSKEHWVIAVMMTGQLIVNGVKDKHTRLSFGLSQDKTLLYNDQRVFGQLRIVDDLDKIKYFRILGPEPFEKEFSDAYLAAALAKTRRPIKNVLLDHTVVAGIGNIYACEILFRCRISPTRPANQIKSSEIIPLRREIITVLKEAIRLRGSSMRNYRDGAGRKGTFNQRIQVYANTGKPCPVCHTPITRIVQSARSTFYCMKCQH